MRQGRDPDSGILGNVVKEDLNKAERRWAQRRLFAPSPRRYGLWLLLVVVFVLCAVFYGIFDAGMVSI